MKRASIAVAALIALTVTGCAGTVASTPDEPEDTVKSAPSETPESTPAPTVEPAPITVTPEPTQEAAQGIPEEEFVAAAQDYLNGWGYWDFTDKQILGAGLFACESSEENPVVIEGIDPGHSVEIVSYARSILCP